ncbi:carbohydrate ABC transporter permease [Peptoniphilaceae bacterium SGI.137]|nr:carbohydrate ABC transporter permease [Peptoniphilaceae bacterium]
MKINKKQWLLHGVFIVILLIFLFPIAFAISNSLKTVEESYNNILSLIPRELTFDNFRYVAERLPILRIIGNTFFIATVVTVVKLLTSVLCAYALVFYDFRMRNTMYFIMLTTMFIPFTVTMIPNYLLISQWNLLDSGWGVMLPQLADVLGIFLLRQSMRSIPKSLIEVARVDNVKDGAILRDIILPLVQPSLISTGAMFFINSWNEFVWPVLILKSKENYTLSLALQMFISAEGGTDFPIAMAVSVITMVIPLLLYLAFQRQIIRTYVQSGLK